MKKLLMVVTVLFSLMLVTGCEEKKKEAITADEFYNRVNPSYTLKDITSVMGFVKKAYSYDSNGISFYFYEGNKSFDMGNIYLDEVENISGNMSNKKDNIDKGENFSTITIYNDTEYYRIAYVENTLLFGKTTMANKVSLDGLFEKAGY